MCYSVVAIGGVDRSNSRGGPRLSCKVAEESLAQCAVIRHPVAFAKDLLRHEVRLPRPLHHPAPIDDLVGSVEVCLH